MRKILLALLSALIILSLLPASALAATGDNHFEGPWVSTELPNGTVELTAYISGTPSGEITIPSTIDGYAVTGIGSGALSSKTAITSVIIPEGVTFIGNGAFAYCSALASVSFPSTLGTIGSAAFVDCTALASVSLPAALTAIGPSVFSGCTNLETVTMQNCAASVGVAAFRQCTKLTSVTLSQRLTSIGPQAFQNCVLLPSINIPGSVQSIGQEAFTGCSSLTSVTLHHGLRQISEAAFFNVPITEIIVPESVTTIDSAAFALCSSLTKATILNDSVSLDSGAFGGASLSDGIYGFADSSAETYASEMHFPFHTIYKITFNSMGGSDVAWDYNVLHGTIDEPSDPTYTGKIFSGWYADNHFTGSAVSFPYAVTGTQSLYAKWVTPYTVAFNANGGDAVNSQTINEGEKAAKPTDPTRSGYVFGGWFADSGLTDAWGFDTDTVDGDTTLYAKWTKLAVSSSDSDAAIYTSGRITLTPSVSGGTWDYDTRFFSLNGNTFSALKAGSSEITYTVNGVSVAYSVTIKQSSLPATGQSFVWVWALCGASALLAAAMILGFSKRKKAGMA